ncbi:GAF domain-containing SpoIIE family protein phosphatase [Streptomyces ziwulingensis]|uniref:PPM-type phosphatase domain-containing protein n=1 Tax=Streptomyces ziwulingensis TaxID=1045501 RepID=A0ABP9CYP4_9ACTN
MGEASGRTEPGEERWSARLHGLWRVSQDVQDVTDMSRYVYESALTEPGSVVVTGTRWVHGELRYLRLATAGRPAPATTTSPAGPVRAGDGRQPPAPGAGPEVVTHDLTAGHADFAPEGAELVAAGARWALESRFRLGDGDWAAVSVGFAERPAPQAATATATRLVQLCEVIVASHHRIVAYREHDKRQIEDAFLAEASLQMDSSLDAQETLRRVARLAVPAMAEGCVVHLCRPGYLDPVASAHVSASVQPWLDSLAREDRWLGGLLSGAVARGESLVLTGDGLTGGPFGTGGEGPGRAVRTVSVNPLRARGKAIGTLTFVYHRDGEDIASPRMLTDLAQRAALAIDTTSAYEQRRRHVELLQRQLLPGALPDPPGVELHAAYEVADASLEVGGDFYDAVIDRDGRLALVIGDVCGRGAEAAAMTGLARHTLRTLLEDGTPAAHALERLNKALLGQSADRFVTALIAVLTSTGQGEHAVEIAAAGHPPPLIRRADGRVEEVVASGVFLGVLPDLAIEPARHQVAPGDVLVLFTDGLTEARSAQGTMFEELLPQAVRECADAPDPAGELIARASKFRALGNDDTAVLVARIEEPR